MTNARADHVDTKSQALFRRAEKVMPGGCSRNTIFRRPHPIYATHGEGAYVFDIDGVARIDFANNMASLIHGHAPRPVVDAVSRQLEKGFAYTLGTEIEVAFAEHMVGRSENFEKIRFVNSGTEGVMSCIKAARAFTGRAKIAKAEGAYHGSYDYAEVSQVSSPENWGEAALPQSTPVAHGTPRAALDDVIVIPFNEINAAIARLDVHKEEIACVLLDLLPHRIGTFPAEDAFVRAMRDWADKNGALLVFDEVITFRMTYGGAQQWYDVRPDLTAMGKMIGGGFPVGAIAGRNDVMQVLDPTASPVLFPHSGTFSANPVTMTAGLTTMEMFDETAVARLNKLGDYARSTLTAAIKTADVEACVTGAGSMFRIHLKAAPPKSYRESYLAKEEAKRLALLVRSFEDNGVLLINSAAGVLSTAMSEADVDRLGEAAICAFQKLKSAQ